MIIGLFQRIRKISGNKGADATRCFFDWSDTSVGFMQRCLFGQITRRNIGNSCCCFFVLSVPFSILCCDKTVLIDRLGMVKKRNLVRIRKISRFGLNFLFFFLFWSPQTQLEILRSR